VNAGTGFEGTRPSAMKSGESASRSCTPEFESEHGAELMISSSEITDICEISASN